MNNYFDYMFLQIIFRGFNMDISMENPYIFFSESKDLVVSWKPSLYIINCGFL